MGHKSNPISFRIKKNMITDSQWYSNYNYSEILHDNLIIEDIVISIYSRLKIIVNQLLIKRTGSSLFVFVYGYSTVTTNKINIEHEITQSIRKFTGIQDQKVFVIFYNYAKIYPLKNNKRLTTIIRGFKHLKKLYNFKDLIHLSYISVKTKNVTGFCYLLAKLLKRKSYPHKQIITFATKLFSKFMQDNSDFIGFRINFKGRLNGKMRAKKLYIQKGRVSLQTIYATIAYSLQTTYSRYGTFGLKIWLCFTKSPVLFVNELNKKAFNKDKLNSLLLPQPLYYKQANLSYIQKDMTKNYLIWLFLYKYFKQYKSNYSFSSFYVILNKVYFNNNIYLKYFNIYNKNIRNILLDKSKNK